MKKLVALMLFLMGSGALWALPLGNPAEPGLMKEGVFCAGNTCDDCLCASNACDDCCCLSWCKQWSFRAGYYGDFVFDRALDVDHSGVVPEGINETTLTTNAGYFALNFCDRLDLFTSLGTTYFTVDAFDSSFGGTGIPRQQLIEIESEKSFSWSVGARAALLEWCCFTLGAEGQYFSTSPDIRRITRASTFSDTPDEQEMKFHEWQVGLGLSYTLNFPIVTVPYVGVKWSHATVNMEDYMPPDPFNETLYNLESRRHFGYAVGVTFVNCDRFSATFEGRFVDETALYVNAEVRF